MPLMETDAFLAASLLHPAQGQVVCGDHVLIRATNEVCLLAVIDGLGHGQGAADAALAAHQVIEQAFAAQGYQLDLMAMMQDLDDNLRDSRGAVVSVALAQGRLVSFVGMGSNRAVLWTADAPRRLPGVPGFLGQGHTEALRRGGISQCKMASTDLLMIATDGLVMPVLPKLPSACMGNVTAACQHLMATFRDPRDDAAVICFKVP